jgi:hypothetical protein
MNKSPSGLSLTLVLALLAGAASSDPRGSVDEFWNFRPNDPGNGTIDLGDDDDDDGLPDTITWTNVGDGTYSEVFDRGGALTLVIEESRIFDAAGNLQCTAKREGRLFKLREGFDGPVLFTATLGRYVFYGDIEKLPVRSTKAWRKLIRRKTAYEFYGPDVYDGWRRFGDVEITGSESVSRANPMRKLLISALISGACGVDGSSERR